jgi:hypothetical protein
LTTKADTRPVSVRTATENEIDQINNTPNAKKLYNAKLIGGAIGAAVPLTVALVSLVKAKGNLSGGVVSKLIAGGQGILAAAALCLTVKAAKAGTAVSNAVTVFFSTRGKSKTE